MGKIGDKMEEIEALRKSIEEMETMYQNIGEPTTLVIGCGGAGNNFVDYFHGLGLDGWTTVGLNTDQAHLHDIKADKRVFIDPEGATSKDSWTHKAGGGGGPESTDGALREIIQGSDIVFLVAGMGGGAGICTTPRVGRIAKEQGAVVIGIAIMPFPVERCRCEKAEEGLNKLKETTESLIVLDNNRLLEIAPNLSAATALNVMNKMISEVIINTKKTLAQTIKTASSMEFIEVLSSYSQNLIEEVEEPEPVQNIIPTIPLHANLDSEQETQTGPTLKEIDHLHGATELLQ
jgi:cell division protein FtsZ